MSTQIDDVSAWRRRVLMGGGIAVLLAMPLVAMQLTDEVAWTAFDFVAAAILLGAAGVGCELVASRVRGYAARAVLMAGIVALFAILWAHGAVGVF